jgi:hypothetical protein
MLADKLHNARSLAVDLRRDGAAVFDTFHGGRDGTLWYYRQVAAVVGGLAPGPLADDLGRAVEELESLAGR